MVKKIDTTDVVGDKGPELMIPQSKEEQKSKYSKEELLAIFDELIFSGEYREDVTIKGKLKVTFRSRSAEETLEISKFLDVQEYKLLSTLQQERAARNLAYSLVTFQGKDISKATFEERLTFIKSKPTPIINAMSTKLADFDIKVEEACSEAEINF